MEIEDNFRRLYGDCIGCDGECNMDNSRNDIYDFGMGCLDVDCSAAEAYWSDGVRRAEHDERDTMYDGLALLGTVKDGNSGLRTTSSAAKTRKEP